MADLSSKYILSHGVCVCCQFQGSKCVTVSSLFAVASIVGDCCAQGSLKVLPFLVLHSILLEIMFK